jgi:hypothetical protein
MRKWRFFLKKQSYDQIVAQFNFVLSQKRQFLRQIFNKRANKTVFAQHLIRFDIFLLYYTFFHSNSFFRIGAEQLLQSLNKLLSLATTGSVSKQPQQWGNMVCQKYFLEFQNHITVIF